jgi:hypothetical protein
MGFLIFLYDVFIISSASVLGIALAVFITSQFVYDKNSKADEDEYIEQLSFIFEESNLDKFSKLERKELPEPELIDTLSTYMDTPLSPVVMCYDSIDKSFIYYCDSRNIPVRFLNVVAQQFVIEHDCRSLYEEVIIDGQPKANTDTITAEVPITTCPISPVSTVSQSYFQWLTSGFIWGMTPETVPDTLASVPVPDTLASVPVPDTPVPVPDTPASVPDISVPDTSVPVPDTPVPVPDPDTSVPDTLASVPVPDTLASVADTLVPDLEEPSIFANYKKNPEVTTRKKMIEKTMNKYRYKGTLTDYENIKTIKQNESLEISFSRFKEMVKNKNV